MNLSPSTGQSDHLLQYIQLIDKELHTIPIPYNMDVPIAIEALQSLTDSKHDHFVSTNLKDKISVIKDLVENPKKFNEKIENVQQFKEIALGRILLTIQQLKFSGYIELLNQEFRRLPVKTDEDFHNAIEALKSIIEPQEKMTIQESFQDSISDIKDMLDDPVSMYGIQEDDVVGFKETISRKIKEKIQQFERFTTEQGRKEKEEYLQNLNADKKLSTQYEKTVAKAKEKKAELGASAEVMADEDFDAWNQYKYGDQDESKWSPENREMGWSLQGDTDENIKNFLQNHVYDGPGAGTKVNLESVMSVNQLRQLTDDQVYVLANEALLKNFASLLIAEKIPFEEMQKLDMTSFQIIVDQAGLVLRYLQHEVKFNELAPLPFAKLSLWLGKNGDKLLYLYSLSPQHTAISQDVFQTSPENLYEILDNFETIINLINKGIEFNTIGALDSCMINESLKNIESILKEFQEGLIIKKGSDEQIQGFLQSRLWNMHMSVKDFKELKSSILFFLFIPDTIGENTHELLKHIPVKDLNNLDILTMVNFTANLGEVLNLIVSSKIPIKDLIGFSEEQLIIASENSEVIKKMHENSVKLSNFKKLSNSELLNILKLYPKLEELIKSPKDHEILVENLLNEPNLYYFYKVVLDQGSLEKLDLFLSNPQQVIALISGYKEIPSDVYSLSSIFSDLPVRQLSLLIKNSNVYLKKLDSQTLPKFLEIYLSLSDMEKNNYTEKFINLVKDWKGNLLMDYLMETLSNLTNEQLEAIIDNADGFLKFFSDLDENMMEEVFDVIHFSKPEDLKKQFS